MIDFIQAERIRKQQEDLQKAFEEEQKRQVEKEERLKQENAKKAAEAEVSLSSLSKHIHSEVTGQEKSNHGCGKCLLSKITDMGNNAPQAKAREEAAQASKKPKTPEAPRASSPPLPTQRARASSPPIPTLRGPPAAARAPSPPLPAQAKSKPQRPPTGDRSPTKPQVCMHLWFSQHHLYDATQSDSRAADQRKQCVGIGCIRYYLRCFN